MKPKEAYILVTLNGLRLSSQTITQRFYITLSKSVVETSD